MRGARRLTIAGLTVGLALAPLPAFGQEAPAPVTNAPADAVGPRELQNFSLQGTVTRPAEQVPQSTAPERPAATSRNDEPVRAGPSARASGRRTEQDSTAATRRDAPAPTPKQAAEAPSTTPPTRGALLPTMPAPLPQQAPRAEPAPAEGTGAGALVPARHLSPIPWILALLALLAGGAFLFWRNRSRPALAGGPQVDVFVPREQEPGPSSTPPPPSVRWLPPAQDEAPSPSPAPASSPAPAPSPRGIVSTGLRPWVEISVQPSRCTVTDENVLIEFELELFNSGNAPARDIMIEAVIVNAGETQDQELANFFARSAGPGQPIEILQPLVRTSLNSQVATSREHIRAIEIGGRQSCVPLLAFNAFYRRASGDAQTSVAYLVGRESKDGKLSPFRLDLGPRIFRGLGGRLLPVGVRR